jgi:hypothetical protein
MPVDFNYYDLRKEERLYRLHYQHLVSPERTICEKAEYSKILVNRFSKLPTKQNPKYAPVD